MIQLNNITLRAGSKLLFRNLNLTIRDGVKYALLGPNGAGKTSLFRMITGEMEAEEGNIFISSDTTIGYLPQDLISFHRCSVMEMVREAFSHYFDLQEKVRILEKELQHVEQPQEIRKKSERLHHLYEQIRLFQPSQFEAEAERILMGLGFAREEFHKPLQQFSGGWQMRAYLARLLLEKPDFLLLDEPTNHLDIQSFQWLENFLQQFPGGVIFISHDKYFVNHLADKILFVDNLNIDEFSAPYEKFEEELAEKYEKLQREFENQQKKLQEMQRFIDRFRYKATKARQVQSRIRQMEKMDRVEWKEKKEQNIAIRFTISQESYREVFSVRNISFAYDSVPVIRDFSAEVYRGDKIGIIGPNGAGKTTLLKLLAGFLKPAEGEILVGKRVQMGYYAQHQVEQLDLNHTILEEVYMAASSENAPMVRSLLGAFLFHDEDQEKKISVLSGGERARVALAKLLVQPFNTLLLDEPTNHLDISSKEILAEALKEYPGTVLLVSHDREFLDAVVNRIFFISPSHQIAEYPGTYSDFARRRPDWFTPVTEIPQPGGKDKKPYGPEQNSGKEEFLQRKQWQKEIKRLEKRLGEVEQRIEEIALKRKEWEQILSNPTSFDPIELTRIGEQYQLLLQENHQLEDEWLNITEKLELLKQQA